MTAAPSPIDFQRALNWLRNTFGEQNIRDDFPQESDKIAFFCIYTDRWPIGKINLHPDDIVAEFSKIQIDADYFADTRWKNRHGQIMVRADELATNLEAAQRQFGIKEAEIAHLPTSATPPAHRVNLEEYTHGAPAQAIIIDLAARRAKRSGRS